MESFESVIKSLQRKLDQTESKKLFKSLEWYKKAFQALSEKSVSPEKLSSIVSQVEEALQFREVSRKQLGKIRREFITTLETDYGLFFKGHFQQKWMLYGMIFGLPFGTIFSAILKNFAFTGIGLPIGMAIGIAIGTEKDNKANSEGKVLDLAV
jgi:hypothetical protein